MVAIRLIGSILPASVHKAFRRGSLLVLSATKTSNPKNKSNKRNSKEHIWNAQKMKTEFRRLGSAIVYK